MIYISLTTVPERLSSWMYFQQNLDSLLAQDTDIPYKIILNIPYFNKKSGLDYTLPEGLLEYKADSRLVINRSEDWGPITKLLGALEYIKEPDALLIVCDDDHVYDPRMIKYHLLKQEKYNNEKIIAFRADMGVKKVEVENEKGRGYYFESAGLPYPCEVDTQAKIPGHWHSVSYRRYMLDDNFLFSQNFLDLAPSDDHLMSYYALKKRLDIIVPRFDEETDWSPINQYRPGYCFPIVRSLPVVENSGFIRFRKDAKHHNGPLSEELVKEISFNGVRYYLNPASNP